MFENYAVLWARIAARRPDLIALTSGGESISYGELERQAGAAAGVLRSQGVGSGDRVAFFLHNTTEFMVLFYACLKLEAIPVSINYRYRGTEVAELLRVSRSSVLIHAVDTRAAAADALAALAAEEDAEARPRLVVEVGGTDAETPDGGDGVPRMAYRELVVAAPADLPEPSRDAEIYIFTGGTTGTPKAVVWGVGDLLHIQQSSTYDPMGVPYPQDLDAAVEIAVDGSLPAVITLPLAPFIHATALFCAMNTMAVGGTVVINPNPSMVAGDVVRLIAEERVTRLIVAGDAVALPLLDALEADRAETDQPSTLTSVLSSGMRFSDETKRRIHAVGQVAIIDILASTEGGPYAMAVTTRAEDLPARFRLAEDAVVLDDGQHEVQDTLDATGILAYRGALPKGYLNDPEKSAQTYPVINGVRHCSPGDYVRVGQDGFIELLGRGSSVVNTGGEKVFPGEVEEVLLEHPAVTDAVVFGVPDPQWGERVAAMVAVEPGSGITEAELMDHVGARLAGYKKPRLLVLRDSLDRGPTGKLNMQKVKESAVGGAPSAQG